MCIRDSLSVWRNCFLTELSILHSFMDRKMRHIYGESKRIPVSYTHLDVYKRQGCVPGTSVHLRSLWRNSFLCKRADAWKEKADV